MAEYIDRNALIEHMKKDPLFDLVEQYGITGVIESFPAADVQPLKHGRWMYCSIEDMFHCTRCDAAAVRNTFVYCPICGARMDGET